MGHGRKVHDEGEARRCLAAARRAGQAAGEWARAHGIDGRSLHAWSVNLAGRRTSERSLHTPASFAHELVELVPEESCGGPAARYVLVVGDARLEFGDDASASTLRRVLEALRTC